MSCRYPRSPRYCGCPAAQERGGGPGNAAQLSVYLAEKSDRVRQRIRFYVRVEQVEPAIELAQLDQDRRCADRLGLRPLLGVRCRANYSPFASL